ncbi:MAG: hypothetical protein ACPIOQ_54145, partial [Promethearchaeia archaeon]
WRWIWPRTPPCGCRRPHPVFEGAACWPVKTFGQAREFRNPDSHDAQKTCIVGMKASAAATNASTRTRCSISALAIAGLLLNFSEDENSRSGPAPKF